MDERKKSFHRHNWSDLESLVTTDPAPPQDDDHYLPRVELAPSDKSTSVRRMTRGGTRFRWKYPFLRLNRSAFAESVHELNLYRCLDACTVVSNVMEQPFWIHYELDGEQRKHVPDAVVAYDHRQVIFEVKERHKAESPEVVHRTHALTPALARLGYVYRVITEEIINRQPRLDNVEWLLRRGRFPVPIATKTEILRSVASQASPCTWADLRDRNFEFAAARLVLDGLLVVDLHQALSPDSVVTVGEGGDHAEWLH